HGPNVARVALSFILPFANGEAGDFVQYLEGVHGLKPFFGVSIARDVADGHGGFAGDLQFRSRGGRANSNVAVGLDSQGVHQHAIHLRSQYQVNRRGTRRVTRLDKSRSIAAISLEGIESEIAKTRIGVGHSESTVDSLISGKGVDGGTKSDVG